MSLFIGRDNKDRAVMHITSGVRTENEMASGVLSDTTFHNYKSYQTYSTNNVYGRLGNYKYYVDNEETYDRIVSYAVLNFGSTINRRIGIGDYHSIYFLNSSNNIISSISRNRIYYTSGLVSWESFHDKRIALEKQYDGNYWSHRAKYTYPAFCVFDGESGSLMSSFLSISKVILIDKTSTKLINKSGVIIGNGDIIVGGISLANFKYIYPGTMNNHPGNIQISAGQQLVDASAISGDIEIEASYGDVVIKKGGYPIIKGETGYIEGTGTITSHNVRVKFEVIDKINTSTIGSFPVDSVIRIKGLLLDKSINTVLEMTNNLLQTIATRSYIIDDGASSYSVIETLYVININGVLYFKSLLNTSGPSYLISSYNKTLNFTIELY